MSVVPWLAGGDIAEVIGSNPIQAWFNFVGLLGLIDNFEKSYFNALSRRNAWSL